MHLIPQQTTFVPHPLAALAVSFALLMSSLAMVLALAAIQRGDLRRLKIWLLVVAGLGWLFDTMDQNLYNLVRAPSLAELLRSSYPVKAELDQAVLVGGRSEA